MGDLLRCHLGWHDRGSLVSPLFGSSKSVYCRCIDTYGAGRFAYKAMIAMVEINHLGYSPELIATCMENFLKAMFIIAGLAVGLAVPGLLFYRRRPIV